MERKPGTIPSGGFLTRVSAEAGNRHGFCLEHHSNRSVCTGTKKHKWQISHDLGEFVLQMGIRGLAICSSLSVCESLPQRAPLKLEHTGLFGWWQLARVNLLRDRAASLLSL